MDSPKVVNINEIDEVVSINESEQLEIEVPDKGSAIKKRRRYIVHQTIVFVYVGFFAVIGCFSRIGIDLIFGSSLTNIESPSSVVVQSFFSNIIGCFMLGTVHGLQFKPGALATGLTTGLCGCLTTYSKWNQQISLLLVGMVTTNSQSQLTSICVIVTGLLTNSCSYITGQDFSGWLLSLHCIRKCRLSDSASSILHCCITVAFVLTVIVLSILIFFYQSTPAILTLCLSVLLAPLGANVRYVMSIATPKFDFKRKFTILNQLPTGTLLANVLGSTAIAVCYVIELHTRSTTSKTYLDGIRTGFLASMTTVSTFIAEVIHLRGKTTGNTVGNVGNTASYAYVCITITLCLVSATLVNVTSFNVLNDFDIWNDLGNLTSKGA